MNDSQEQEQAGALWVPVFAYVIIFDKYIIDFIQYFTILFGFHMVWNIAFSNLRLPHGGRRKRWTGS